LRDDGRTTPLQTQAMPIAMNQAETIKIDLGYLARNRLRIRRGNGRRECSHQRQAPPSRSDANSIALPQLPASCGGGRRSPTIGNVVSMVFFAWA
jgi:hypothetical protein